MTTRKEQLDEIRKKVAALLATNSPKKDSDGYYQSFTDNNGNGSAIIRFLEAFPGEEWPFVQVFSHAFQVDDKWFIDLCPTTLNLPCPVCEDNAAQWKNGKTDVASIRKRKLYYHSNILVVRDPKQPENEGKVFLYKYGKKIFDKIKDAITPPFPDTLPFDPFDSYEGANFYLRITQKNGFRDYDKSSFDPQSEIGSEDYIASVLNERRSLDEIVAPHQFKSYEELKAKFDKMTGQKAA